MPSLRPAIVLLLSLLALPRPAAAAGDCLAGPSAISDAAQIAAVPQRVEAACPCIAYDGSASTKSHGAYLTCARAVIVDIVTAEGDADNNVIGPLGDFIARNAS